MPKARLEFTINSDKEKFDSVCNAVFASSPYEFKRIPAGFEVKEKRDLWKNTYAATAVVSYEENKVVIEVKIGGIGPIQSRHVKEVAEIIQGLIQRGIEENTIVPSDEVRCPKCGSTQIQLNKRGWTASTGLLGSSRNERICLKCLHKF